MEFRGLRSTKLVTAFAKEKMLRSTFSLLPALLPVALLPTLLPVALLITKALLSAVLHCDSACSHRLADRGHR